MLGEAAFLLVFKQDNDNNSNGNDQNWYYNAQRNYQAIRFLRWRGLFFFLGARESGNHIWCESDLLARHFKQKTDHFDKFSGD